MKAKSRYFRVKEYHDFRDGRVLIKGELVTRRVLEKHKYPREWFKEVIVDLSNTYLFFGSRFILEEEV